MRQVVESYAGQRLTSDENCLHIVLTGAIGNALDAPSRFNQMSSLERVAFARDALARAGVVDLAPAGRALDEAPREDCRLSAEDAEFFRGLAKRLKARKRRRPESDRDNRVSADSATAGMERAVRQTRDFGYRETDRGSKLPRATRVMDSGRPAADSVRGLDFSGRPMSDLEYFQRAAAWTTGGVYRDV